MVFCLVLCMAKIRGLGLRLGLALALGLGLELGLALDELAVEETSTQLRARLTLP